MTARELRLVLPATAENILVVRQAMAGVGEAVGLGGERIADLKTVVTEACNNVVLHAYEKGAGPLEVTAIPGDGDLEIVVADHGHGFKPRANETGDATLGLGLPLIAALSDSFAISGSAGHGTSTKIRFAYVQSPQSNNGRPDPDLMPAELAMAITPGAMVKPVLARVIGALATRAEFSVDRLADTVLLGDAVSAHQAGDFSGGQVGISIKDGDGTLDVRVGPLVEGAGERLLAGMEVPGLGSLRTLARSMEVTKGETEGGQVAEFLTFEVER